MYVKPGVMFCAGVVWLAGVSAARVRAQGQGPDARAREVVAQLPVRDSARTRRSARTVDQPITLDLHKVPVKDALRAIAKQSGVVLFYNDQDIPAERRVSVTIANATVADALRVVLRGTGLAAHATAEGIVIERRKAPAKKEQRERQEQQSAISGRVTDAKTGEGIGGVNVTVEGTELRAISGESGAYRIGDVASGQYTVTAKRLGYEQASQSVVVTDDQDAVVDFALVVATTMLDQVVVTGTVVPTEAKALPTPITVITAADIADQPAPRLTQILRQAVPGANAPDGSVFTMQTAMSVRGAASLLGASGTMKVYIDGIEVADKTLAGVDPNSIDHIEVIRGPEAAAIYGSDAIGGVMQIFTKRGNPNLPHPELNAQITLGVTQNPYENRDALRQKYSASLRGGTGTASYNLGASYTREGDWLPNYFLSNPTVYGGVHMGRERLTLDVSARYLAPSVGRPLDPRAARTGYVPFTKPYYRNTSEPTVTYGAHLTYRPTSWWRQSLTAGVDGTSFGEHSLRPRLTTPSDTLLYVGTRDETKRSLAYNTSVTVPLASDATGIVTVGFDHYELTINNWYTIGALNNTGTIGTAPGFPPAISNDITTNSGYFIQGQLNLHDALFLTGAVRAERNSNFGNALGTPFSPRGGISYVHRLGAAAIKLRASYGEAISPPKSELKSAANTGFQIQLENLVLGPERQAGGDAGLDLIFGTRGSLGITGYDQTADGLIEQVLVDPATSPPTYQYQNVGRVKNRGIEVEGALHLRAVDLRAQYAFTSSRVQAIGAGYTGPLQVGDQSLLVPRHTAAMSITVKPSQRIALDAWLNYIGTRRQTDFLREFSCFGGTGPCAPSARDYLTTYPAFVQTNLSATYDVTSAITAFFSVQDITNGIYDSFGNATPNAGRITLAGVRIRSGM